MNFAVPGDQCDLIKTAPAVSGFFSPGQKNVFDLKNIKMPDLTPAGTSSFVNGFIKRLKRKNSRHVRKVQKSNKVHVVARCIARLLAPPQQNILNKKRR